MRRRPEARGLSPSGHHAAAPVDYATALMETIRDARLRRCFSERPMVAALFDATPSPLAETGTTVKRPSAPSMP